MRKFTLLILSIFAFMSCTHADTKKEIKASEIITLLKKGKHIRIVDKIILDDLDFTLGNEPFIVNANMLESEITSNIFFSNCVFMGKVATNGKSDNLAVTTVFKNNVTFFACDFRDEVNFERTVVFGMFNFNKSIFRKNANFNSLTIWSKDCYFSEVKAEDNFSMVYASFWGNLFFVDTKFDKSASFQETSIKGKLSFNNAEFKQNAGFDLIDVSGNAFFNYVTFEKSADFSFSKFMNRVDFISTTFKEKGRFEKTFFLNTVRFEGIDLEKDLILTDTFFGNKYERQVDKY